MPLDLDDRGRRYLDRFRQIAFSLPEVIESESFGHPWFRIGGGKGKMVSVFGFHEGHWTISFKAGKTEQGIFLQDPRFFKTPYIGQHGWVTLKLPHVKPGWEEVAELLKMSYRNNAPSRLKSRV
ncbi:MAG TPA: MmcQ/YjbR family DNA-binding protein [Bryobacteraceae bacterium]|nr:MmcQ/YjbR family DNA-binding protein [Bryobacteraceae bacterium]